MVRIFDIENSKVIPTEHCYTLKFLKNIMDRHPADYMTMYMYIFYMCCPDPDQNPFFDVPEEDKEDLILQEIGADFSTDDPDVTYALDKCKALYQTPTYRAYIGMKTALDNIAKVLATEIPTFGRDGSATDLMKIAKEFDGVRQSFKGVYRDLIEEQKSTVRGGQNLAYDQ